MPEHSSWLTLALEGAKENLAHNAGIFGRTMIGQEQPTWHSFEPFAAALLVALLVIAVALLVRRRLVDVDEAVVAEDRLTLRTFIEAFFGYFYDLAKSVMDAERAKKYFPIIGTAAIFVFFSNLLALIPGMPVATTSLNITLGSALVGWHGTQSLAHRLHLEGNASPLPSSPSCLDALRHPTRQGHMRRKSVQRRARRGGE